MSMQYSTKKLAENKLIILHLLQKMGISLSNSEICQFLLEKNYMDYFSVQQYLSELETAGWLEKTREQNNTRYTLTDDGEEVMNYFISRMSDDVKNEINTYVRENNKRIRAEYAVTANYFPEMNGDFLVKCGLCDDTGATLMEISVSVVSKHQAQNICRNWKKNVNQYYRKFLSSLAMEETDSPKEEE
ncbi:MAG: DUF4364 family protein [Anaerotignum sp.]|nr:DUF4364 family protein [Anaerotignum sp.]